MTFTGGRFDLNWGQVPMRARASVRLLACLLIGIAGLACWSSAASAEKPSVLGGVGSQTAVPASSTAARYTPLVRPLVIPGAELFFGGQVAWVQWARWASPGAVVAREESLTRFAHLGAAQAAVVARSAFGGLVDEPAGGTPRLPAGGRLVGFAGARVARAVLPGGKRAVIESLEPMAIQTASGHLEPVNLTLRNSGTVFRPVASPVAVQIPKALSSGVRTSRSGVSLTPIDDKGRALRGSGAPLQGVSVLYANTQRDTDTLVKPTDRGFELDTILRSEDSPHKLYYRVGLPRGVGLLQRRPSGPIEVTSYGATLGMVIPPTAVDAVGASVPVRMEVKGDVLTVTIAATVGEYEYPIAVDPEYDMAEDRSLTGGVFPVEPYKGGTNWLPFYSAGFSEEHTYKKSYSCGSETYWCEQSWYIEPNREYNASEFAGLSYTTQGESTIYNLEMWVEGENEPSQTTTEVEYRYGPKREGLDNHVTLSSGIKQERYKFEPLSMTSGYFHNPLETPRNNEVRIMDYTTKHESIYGFWTWIWAARVYVAQEESKHPEAEPTSACPQCGFNTGSATISGAENRANVLYGSGSWLSPSQGAYEVTAHDPGIGVSFAAVSGAGMSDEKFIRNDEGACKGIQCPETYSKPLTYLPTMANGEDLIELFAEDAAGLDGYTYKTIKVDAAKPYNVRVKGMAEEGAEISAAPHTLTFEATDGTKPTSSSGIKSITVSVDGGQPVEVPGVYCAPGECTGKGEWALHAESLSEGVHQMTITATDNAGNSQPRRVFFDVRHAAPVALGPGSVDPTTGQFSLNATDVSLSGVSGVSRTYQSRNLTAGAEGPLGSQWSVNLGAGEGLSVLPTGDVELQASGGAVTTFHRNEKGEYESPQGDSNLKVEPKEKEAGKGITEYIVKDSSGGTSTHYTQPAGERPTFSTQFGDEVAGELKEPVSEAPDASGNLWVTDFANSRIEKFSPTGLLQAAYGSYGSEAAQFEHPWGIAVNQSNGNVYVTDQGNYRVEEFSSSGTFIRAFGEKGTGTGQFGILAGVAVDSSGNVWVADYGNNRIEEFNESGVFQKAFGSEGTGNGQFKGPLNIAFSGGHIYVTDYGNSRVEKFSMTGTYESQIGKSGSGNGEFKGAYGIATEPATGNLYVVDNGNKRVEEFSAAGSFIAKFGASGTGSGQFSGPTGIGVSTAGNIYVADATGSRVEEWARSAWLPTIGEGPLPSASTTYAYQTAEVGEELVLEPAEALAPAPPGVSCAPKLEKGCRALSFNYATSTTATGENEPQWGDYKGHLTRVYFTAWDPSKGEMTETIVAQYAYDSKGRLRAEWDPRISPALKTIYGYDAEGHVTALTRAGQETIALTYGTVPGDANPGRLLKETQAPASAVLWNGEPVANTKEPKLSGTPTVGTTMGVSAGTWSNNPVAYGYQWEDCNAAGKECAAIAGATNANYTVATSDSGHTLVAEVTATNGGGSVTVTTSASGLAGTPLYSLQFGSKGEGSGQFRNPYDLAADSKGNVWVSDAFNDRVQEFNGKGEYLKQFGSKGKSNGQLEYPYGVAVDAKGNIWVADSENERVEEFNEKGEYVKQFGSKGSGKGQFDFPFGVAVDSKGNVWVTSVDFVNRVEEFNEKGELLKEFGKSGSGNGEFGEPYGIVIDPEGHVWVTDYTNDRVEEFTEAGEYLRQFGSKGTGPGQFEGPSSITMGPNGYLWVADRNNSRVQEFTTKGEFLTSIGSKGTGNGQFEHVFGVAADTKGDVWATDLGNDRVEEWSPTTAIEGEHYAPGPGVTIEYHVPAYGSGAPHNLSETEVSKWGQNKDLPAEGMAIFPPDEPQSWPATDYKRATIQYFDSEGRLVNTVGPTGGIATTEYNALNEADRTLSADNRATALKESCESKEHCKSAEVATKLDTENTYNTGGQLVETLGPEHKVKLASGSEVLARGHMVYHYDEGAPETGEEYSLVTKTTDGAEYEDKEADIRTTLTSYSGQKGLGWTLRKPTSMTTDPTGLDLTTTTEYNETTGNVVATKSPAGTSQAVSPPVYSAAFGSKGSGGGQFSEPMGVAVDATGDVWVTDQTNNRVEKFSPTGSFIAAYGVTGSGELQFSNPAGIAVNQSTGNVYVCDLSNSRVEELNSSGGFVRTFGSTGEGKLEQPIGVTIDANGNVWVLDLAADRVEEFSAAGAYINGFGSKGSGPGQLDGATSLTISEGDIYVVDAGNNRVEEFSTSGTYLGQFGSEGSGEGQFKEPFGIGVNVTTGDLYVSDSNNSRVEEFTPAGKFLTTFGLYGSGNGRFNEPLDVALNSTGALYAVDFGNYRVQKWLPPETGGGHMAYSTQFGSYGSGEGQFYYPVGVAFDGHGNVWADDENNHRVEEFSAQGKFIAAYGSYGTGNGEFGHPTGIDVNQSTGDVYIADCEDNRIQELSSKGEFIRTFGKYGTKSGELDCPNGLKIDSSGNVWVADTKNNRVEEFSSSGSFIATYGSEGSGNGQFKEPTGLTIAGGNVYVVDTGNTRVQELSTSGAYIRQFGSQGSGGGEFWNPNGIAANSAGDLYVVDIGDSRIEEFSSTGGYLGTFGSAGSGEEQLHYPQDVAVNAAGDVYVSDTGDNRIEVWAPNSQAVHDIKTIYYTAKEEAEATGCRNHPEWVGLPCESTPAAQPESGLPELPVKTYTYNIWDEIEITTETVTSKTGATTRTIKETYDTAGRALTSETSSTVDTALPKVTNEYSSETGALIRQSATIKGGTKTIGSKYNTLGQLVEYTDAEGSATKYSYDVDGRPAEVSYELPGKASDSQVYSYDSTTGLMTELRDTVPGTSMTFTASYDAEGKLTSEGYPNGMSAGYTISPTGQATSVEYVKLTHCSEKCTWFGDSVTSSIHGEMLVQASTLAGENYSYDAAGRLTQTQETPAGKGCTTRVYTYDEDSDRRSLATVQPGSEGQCESEGGSVERHVYDPADRLADEGVVYETFGSATTMPAGDAGGHELTSSYYVDGQLAGEKQNGETLNYVYDPAGRTLETVSEGTSSGKAIDHYAGSGEAVAWVSEGGETWTRNVPGIDGTLDAVQKSGQAPVLQLHDLEGNVVGTAALSETETKLLSTYNSTEFGVPQPGTTPPKYAWLGSGGLASEPAFGSGVTVKGGASYVPQVAQNLQSYPVIPPGAFPNGLGAATPYTAQVSSAAFASAEAQAAKNYDETEAARQAAKHKEEEEQLSQCRAEGGCGADIGPEEDPEGILTGGEALKWAKELREEADAITVAVEQGLGELPGDENGEDSAPGVNDLLRDGAEVERGAADMLEECYNRVHNGKPSTGPLGEYVTQTGVCFYHFKWRGVDGFNVVTFFQSELCWDRPHQGIDYEWYCEGDKRWWHFNN